MLTLIGRFIVIVGTVYFIATYIPGIHVDSTETVFLVAVVWSLIIMFIRPVLKLLTLPLRILTLGFFTFVLNMSLFGLMALIVPGFTVHGVLSALVGSLILSAVTFVIDHTLG